MRRREAIDGPSAEVEPEDHKWVASFLLVPPEEGAYAFDDVHLLDYVPETANPAVAFDGLVEKERTELARDDENPPNLQRITLALYDEKSASEFVAKDAIGESPEPIWSFKETFGLDAGGVSFEEAVTEFQRDVGASNGPDFS